MRYQAKARESRISLILLDGSEDRRQDSRSRRPEETKKGPYDKRCHTNAVEFFHTWSAVKTTWGDESAKEFWQRVTEL